MVQVRCPIAHLDRFSTTAGSLSGQSAKSASHIQISRDPAAAISAKALRSASWNSVRVWIKWLAGVLMVRCSCQ
jgi:hypothetical protein